MSHISLQLLHSNELIQARRRIFRQLIESLLYEQIVTGPAIANGAETEYELYGKADSGEQVAYRFKASRKKAMVVSACRMSLFYAVRQVKL